MKFRKSDLALLIVAGMALLCAVAATIKGDRWSPLTTVPWMLLYLLAYFWDDLSRLK